MHEKRPVRAGLALQEPPEDGQGHLPGEVGQLRDEGALDDEVGALPGADLGIDHTAHDVRVLLVRDVEPSVDELDRPVREPGQSLAERHRGLLTYGHGEQ